jgi:hypothetical protein
MSRAESIFFALLLLKQRHARHACVRAPRGVNHAIGPIAIFLLAASLIASATVARAGCNEDCKSEYVSALGECRTEYEQGEEDLHDLEDCLVDTRSEYDDCIDDCTSLGAGGVVACKSSAAGVMPVLFIAPQQRN